MKNEAHTRGPWWFDVESLTIRADANDTSNCMGDYKGSVIADLKPSLGIQYEDELPPYANHRGARQHAWNEVLANGMRLQKAVAVYREDDPVQQIPQATADELCQQLCEALDKLSEISDADDKDDRQLLRESLGVAKYLIQRAITTIEE